ncbi:hypothetical protein [Desulfocicer niacini]
MAEENNNDSNQGPSIPSNEDFGKNLPITNTTTPMPNVKPPRETPSSGSNEPTNQSTSDN